MSTRLHAIEAGSPDAPTLVLLHGFGGHAASWSEVLGHLPTGVRVISFDLPGHAGSLNYPGFGSPRTAALAVLNELTTRGIRKAHIAGHSMGGAVAVLIALEDPAVVQSLTLVAPGGFGPEMDGQALRDFAEARTAEELGRAYAAMMAPDAIADPDMISALFSVHARPGQKEALHKILERISRGTGQGELPLGALQKWQFPACLLWGMLDTIVPFAQSANAPDWFLRAAIPGKGHMLLDEAPQKVAAALLDQLRKSPRTA